MTIQRIALPDLGLTPLGGFNDETTWVLRDGDRFRIAVDSAPDHRLNEPFTATNPFVWSEATFSREDAAELWLQLGKELRLAAKEA